MIRGRLTLFFITAVIAAFSQEVDLVRLGYSKTDVAAEQRGMAVSPDGRFVAFLYSDKTIKIFDASANRFIKKFIGPYDMPFDIQLTANGKIVLVHAREVQLIDWKEERVIQTFTLLKEVTKTAFLGKHNLIAVGQKGGIVEIFDLNKQTRIQEFKIGKSHVGALAIHPDGKQIVIGVISPINFLPNPLTLFDIESGIEQTKSKETGYFTMAAFNETGSELLVAGLNGSCTVTFLKALNGKDLSHQRDLGTEINLINSVLAYGGMVADDKLMAITLSQAFNVNDAKTGSTLFTTKSDRVKFPPIWKFGVGAYNVFPLGGGRLLLNATKNNINQIYDTNTNTIVGYFFSESNEDFAVIARDGRVDGTPDALAKLYWTARNSLMKTSLESTFEKGFSPKLLSQIITENANEQVAFEVDNVIGKIPLLSVSSINGKAVVSLAVNESAQKQSTIEVKVVENENEVTEVKLYQNAKLISVIPKNATSKYVFDATLTSSFGEQNFFYVTASSKSGIESEKAKFIITYKGISEEKPKLYLLTIGINQYRNQKYNLNYAQADADGVEGVIKKNSGQLFNDIIYHNIRNDKATKTNILAAIEDIKKKALEQDVLLVYYAGHGVMAEEATGGVEFFIVPHDITQLYGRIDLLKEKGISASSLKQHSKEINAQKQIFILDACQSAGALESVTLRGAAEEKAIAQLARSTGTFWITATGSDQFASEFEKLGHGIFTYSLLEGIGGAADTNGDKKLTVRELSTFIENRVPELSEQLKGSAQYPSAYSFGNDFPIVVYQQ